jgi:hypothetical protein
VLEQERRQRGRKVYSLHAPEVGCIGKGKAHRPYEFWYKAQFFGFGRRLGVRSSWRGRGRPRTFC